MENNLNNTIFNDNLYDYRDNSWFNGIANSFTNFSYNSSNFNLPVHKISTDAMISPFTTMPETLINVSMSTPSFSLNQEYIQQYNQNIEHNPIEYDTSSCYETYYYYPSVSLKAQNEEQTEFVIQHPHYSVNLQQEMTNLVSQDMHKLYQSPQYSTTTYSKRLQDVNFENIFNSNEIIKILNKSSAAPHKLETILSTLEDKQDNIKVDVIIKYFKLPLIYQCKLLKNKRPITFPNTIDILNLPRSIKDSKQLLILLKHFYYIVNECFTNDKILLLNSLHDSEKVEFIKYFSLLNDLSLKQIDSRHDNINLLIRILNSFTIDATNCANVLKNYLELHFESTYGDFRLFEELLLAFRENQIKENQIRENKFFDIFEHTECSIVIGKAVKEFNYYTGIQKINPFISSINKKLRCKVFKVLSETYDNLRFYEIVSIMKIINSSELCYFFNHCSKLNLKSCPDEYNKNKIKFNYNKAYSKLYKKDKQLLIFNDELACITYLNKVITNTTNLKSVSNNTCDNHIYKEEEIVETLISLIKMFYNLKYDKDRNMTLNPFQIALDVVGSNNIDRELVVTKLLDIIKIRVKTSNVYNSFKKFIAPINNIAVYETLVYCYINNVISNNCKTINCSTIKRLIEQLDCNHYKILFQVILDNQNLGLLQIFNNNHDNNCYNIQLITEATYAKLKNDKVKNLLNNEHYSTIASCFKILFWDYLISQKSNYLPQFETILLDMVGTDNLKVLYSIEFLNSNISGTLDIRHKEDLITLISNNIVHIDVINVDSIDIKMIVTKSNIDILLCKLQNHEKLLAIEYLIQNEMNIGRNCDNYVFSKLESFLRHFEENTLEFIKMLSKYINVPKRIYNIKANKCLFGDEYDNVMKYIESL